MSMTPAAAFEKALSLLDNAREEYKDKEASIDSLQNELKETKSQLTETKASIDSLQNELKETKSQLTETKSQLQQTVRDLAATKNELQEKEVQEIKNQLKNILKLHSVSVVFGPGHHLPHKKEESKFTVSPDGATRILGGWWSLQHDLSNSRAFKQFYIKGTDGETITVGGKNAIFLVGKRNDDPGAIRVTLFVLYV